MHLRPRARRPKWNAVNDAIAQWAAVFTFGSFHWRRNAHKLGFKLVGRSAHGGVAVSAEIEERELRRVFRIACGARPRRIISIAQHKRRAHAMQHRRVERALRGAIRPVVDNEGPSWLIP